MNYRTPSPQLQCRKSLSLDHDFEVFAWHDHRTVARPVASLDESQQLLGETSLLRGIERRKSLVHRTVVSAEDFDPMRG
jgi:hypothetical protein